MRNPLGKETRSTKLIWSLSTNGLLHTYGTQIQKNGIKYWSTFNASPPLASASWHSGTGDIGNNNQQIKKIRILVNPTHKSGFDLTSSTNKKQINRQKTNPLNNFYKYNASNQEHILLKSPTEQTRLAALPSFQSQSNHFITPYAYQRGDYWGSARRNG